MSEGFVGRWSRLKAAERRRKAGAAAPEAEPSAAAMPTAAPVMPPVDAGAVRPDPTANLPPVESLTKDSDFTSFLKEGVPEALRNAALRRLWRSDPVLAAPEALDLHNLDYTLPKVPEVVRTAYRVGKGFVDEVEAAEAKADRLVGEGGTERTEAAAQPDAATPPETSSEKA